MGRKQSDAHGWQHSKEDAKTGAAAREDRKSRLETDLDRQGRAARVGGVFTTEGTYNQAAGTRPTRLSSVPSDGGVRGGSEEAREGMREEMQDVVPSDLVS